MYYVYILHSTTLDSYYVGETQSLDERIAQHNTGFYKNS
ncbi:MAG: GIY-YIG nuclease family protein [Bacteroidetes bacterium]|nr:GIY-YIG nuclease family protein [Bacteroidota bacterium]